MADTRTACEVGSRAKAYLTRFDKAVKAEKINFASSTTNDMIASPRIERLEEFCNEKDDQIYKDLGKNKMTLVITKQSLASLSIVLTVKSKLLEAPPDPIGVLAGSALALLAGVMLSDLSILAIDSAIADIESQIFRHQVSDGVCAEKMRKAIQDVTRETLKFLETTSKDNQDSIETKLDVIDANLDTVKDIDLPRHESKLDIIDRTMRTRKYLKFKPCHTFAH